MPEPTERAYNDDLRAGLYASWHILLEDIRRVIVMNELGAMNDMMSPVPRYRKPRITTVSFETKASGSGATFCHEMKTKYIIKSDPSGNAAPNSPNVVCIYYEKYHIRTSCADVATRWWRQYGRRDFLEHSYCYNK